MCKSRILEHPPTLTPDILLKEKPPMCKSVHQGEWIPAGTSVETGIFSKTGFRPGGLNLSAVLDLTIGWKGVLTDIG